MLKDISNRTASLILLLIVLAAFVLRLLNATTSNIWLDEQIGLMASSGLDGLPPKTNQVTPHDLHQLNTLSGVIHGTNVLDYGKSFFYYVLLHYWMMLFGTNDFAIRMLSVYLGTLSVFFIYVLVQRLDLPRAKVTGFIAASILTLHQMHYWASIEARPYPLALLLSLLGTLIFLEALRKEGKRGAALFYWSLYGLIMGLSLLSHYLSGYIMIGHGLYFVATVRRPWVWLRYALGVSITVILLLIWLSWGAWDEGSQITQFNMTWLKLAQSHTTTQPNLFVTTPGSVSKQAYDLLTHLWDINSLPSPPIPFWTKYLLLPFTLIFYFLLAQRTWQNFDLAKKRLFLLFFGLVLISPLCATALAIKAGHTFSFQPKYATFAIPYAALFLAIIATQSTGLKRWIRITALSLLGLQVFCGIFAGKDKQVWPTRDTFAQGWPRTSNEHVQASTRALAQRYQPGDLLIYKSWSLAEYASLYLPDTDTIQIRVDETEINRVTLLHPNGEREVYEPDTQ